MKRTRPLWISIIVVAVLVVSSAIGFLSGSLKPTLGLDLQGGLSVILAAPEGTPKAVLEQALENIRSRVDAFGVGEPDIFITGTNIEIQLPGLAPGTLQARPKDQYCLTTTGIESAPEAIPAGTSFGCGTGQAQVQKALAEVSVTPQPKTICVVDAKGNPLDATTLCFATQALADAAKTGITVSSPSSASPSVAGPVPSASASPSAAPTPSPDAGQFCLKDSTGASVGCFKTQKAAVAAQGALTTKVTENVYCLTAPATVTSSKPASGVSPSAAPTPSPSGKAKKSATPTPTPTPTTKPSAFSQLSRDDSGAPLPCDANALKTKPTADAALGTLKVTHETQHYCVISSAGTNLGCYLLRSDAVVQQKATGQQHLLDVIGQTARLEERQVQQIIPPSDPTYASTPLTCSTPAEQQTPACSFDALAKKPVVYLGPDGQSKFKLAPIVLSGTDIAKATAVLNQATQTSLAQGWAVSFQLKGDAVGRFGDLTTRLAVLPSGDPTKQIAIAIDRTIISSPQVTGAITGGSGEITGNFTEQRAKDLATQLNAGALPVELTRQSIQTVSPTLGQQSLHQGIVAGIAGLVTLFLYLLFYYRLLGIVAWFGMSIWATLAFALVSVAGSQFGYSLSLAGVAGLVISLGVTADSYIVFFERLKDEVRNGKTPRSAVQPAFKRAYRTIVAADLVTGIAAVVLYLTAVSSVKGFALTLGVATGLDLFVVYFFKRPTVFLIARNERLVNLRGFGLRSGIAGDAEPAPISGAAE